MIRALGTALLCAAAVMASDLVFRTSLLQQVRPAILSPTPEDVVTPPVQLRWEGPQRMRVRLSAAGEALHDLGVHESPYVLQVDQFPRDAGYEIEISSPRFGALVHDERWFQVHAPETPPSVSPERPENGKDGKDLVRALEAARSARDRAQERMKFLREENGALRDESARLAKQLEALYKTQEDEAGQQSELEGRLTQLSEENRALAEENAAVRQRLSTVNPCTVWGYYSYPHPQTIPVTRRFLMTSDARGQIFRAQVECETLRRSDPTAVSICFCVGNSFGG